MTEVPVAKIVRSNRKTLSMSVLPDSSLVVKAPLYLSERQIQSFIQDHIHWIEKQRLKVQKNKPSKKQYTNGEEFMFLGKRYSLQTGSFVQIETKENFLLFPRAAIFRAQKELTNWYIAQAKKIITQQVEMYAKQMGVSFISISFSDTKSKWGSCTHDNRLQFNWRLVMAPLFVINYVVVHELVHILEKNHSRSFWNKVRLYNPSYRQQIKWLKENGDFLKV